MFGWLLPHSVGRRIADLGSQKPVEIFLSYSGRDSFEAGLLQFAIEQMLSELRVIVWTYERDQARDERKISQSLKTRVQKSSAAVFLTSPSTFVSGAAQWMELAYADAFDVPIFVLLHRLTFAELKRKEEGVPPLLLEGQCNPADHWKDVVEALRCRLQRGEETIAPRSESND